MNEPSITAEVIAAHGLTPDEYQRVEQILGRAPNYTELGIFSVMWSEHCSYKSSRVHLRKFPTTGPRVVQGPGENAGVIDIGDGWVAAFKMESHNHPSFIEPYQGAATGVGGILRDIFTMGARPIACLDSLRFGELDAPRMKYLVDGVVRGISGYGNCMGIPTIGGETSFHRSYNGNILVNVFALGVTTRDRIFTGVASGVGNPVIYVGSKTGRDGIHGATMASAEFDEASEEKRPTVQVGDPFTEKLLLEACLEIMESDAVVGIQDMGAAGLTSSSFEMAGRAGTGVRMNLDRVPVRESGMTPYEIMLSESQERMLIVAKRGREDEVVRVFEKWDLNAAVVGEVTDDGFVRLLWSGEEVAAIPVDPISTEAPVYERPIAAPDRVIASTLDRQHVGDGEMTDEFFPRITEFHLKDTFPQYRGNKGGPTPEQHKQKSIYAAVGQGNSPSDLFVSPDLWKRPARLEARVTPECRTVPMPDDEVDDASAGNARRTGRAAWVRVSWSEILPDHPGAPRRCAIIGEAGGGKPRPTQYPSGHRGMRRPSHCH